MKVFLLLSFLALVILEANGYTAETDGQALLKFKSQISEEKRAVLSSWNHSSHFCNWEGVTCGRKHKRVTRLNLGNFSLGGVISPSIGNLSFLISLDLNGNSFGGTIPQEVGNLFRLEYLDMGLNSLGGQVPVSLYNCSRLSSLLLDYNQLGESVSSKIGSLTKLVNLNLYSNNLRGKLPASLGNLTSLNQLTLAYNKLEGEIPSDLAKLTRILNLQLVQNNFSGVFPPAIYNFSSLKYLGLAYNNFFGRLRPDFGILLPNLLTCNLGWNYLTGVIPTTISNISTLQRLGMNENSLTGNIPFTFGKIPNLKWLLLSSNSLGSYSSKDFEFLTSLTNCTQLEKLAIGWNRLGGDFPVHISNLSSNLITLEAGRNFISGRIRHDIGNLISLQTLTFHQNMLSGPLPTSLGKLLNLRVVRLSSNRLSGEVPSFISNFTMLETLDLANNSFQGIVPPSLGKCSNLLHLDIKSNQLNGKIPREIMQIQRLLLLDMSGNSLVGSLPEDIGKLENLGTLAVSDNKLSGRLPQTMGNCLTMEYLYLEGNNFVGDIPDMRRLVGLKEVDFSKNNLSGSIPEYLTKFPKLQYLNLSVNKLNGRVPTQGIFQNITMVSIFGNKDLCGGIKEFQLKPCLRQEPKRSSHLKKIAVGVSVGILLLMFVAAVSLIWFRKREKNKKISNPTSSSSALEVFHEKISYGDLRNATNSFSESNMVGSGSFGTVFKAFLPALENNVVVVAVKVLSMQRRGAMKSFMAECASLKDIRHRNLVKLLTACSSIDFQGNEFRALIYEFMPKGSIDAWLHPENVEELHRPSRALTLLERLNIAVDVASALDYLHVHCHERIAHCDLKPSNVLLDDDLTAHVSDFGLARLLDQESFFSQLTSACVRGTVGYAAPEYGMGAQPSIHGDVYSFGVLLLETFTGKRPSDELFGGDFTLISYTKTALPERVLEIADKTILQSGLRVGFPVAECLTLVLNVGLRCAEESPMNRLATSEAAKELVSIRERFFKATRTVRR